MWRVKMDPMIKNSFFTILIYWNDNRIHLGLTKKLIFFIWFPPLIICQQHSAKMSLDICKLMQEKLLIYLSLEISKCQRKKGDVGIFTKSRYLQSLDTCRNFSNICQLFVALATLVHRPLLIIPPCKPDQIKGWAKENMLVEF